MTNVGVSIVRPGAADDTEIRMLIRVEMGKTISITMCPEDFALALTGKSDMPGVMTTRNVDITTKQKASKND